MLPFVPGLAKDIHHRLIRQGPGEAGDVLDASFEGGSYVNGWLYNALNT